MEVFGNCVKCTMPIPTTKDFYVQARVYVPSVTLSDWVSFITIVLDNNKGITIDSDRHYTLQICDTAFTGGLDTQPSPVPYPLNAWFKIGVEIHYRPATDISTIILSQDDQAIITLSKHALDAQPGNILDVHFGLYTGAQQPKFAVYNDNLALYDLTESQTVTSTISSSTASSSTTQTSSSTTSSTTTSSNSTSSSTTTSSTTTSTFSQATVPITVTANPSGSIVVDGTTYTSPKTFSWVPGSSHSIAAYSPVSGAPGTKYVWTSWADGGTQSRTITAPSSSTTYTANYQTQWQVAFDVNPSAGGEITVNTQPSATAWYNDGAVVSLRARANTGYVFSSWSSNAALTTFANSSSSSTTATIRGTGTITASFLLKDTTPPVITPTFTPSPNGNGWNNGFVTVSWSVSDPESGAASSTGCTAITLNSATPLTGTTLTCTATNGAGLSNSVSATVRIDLGAPTLTLPSLTVEATSSSGALVSYSAGASDSLSGLETFSCTPPSGSTFPIASTTISCSAKDKADNSTTGTFAVTVQDKTPPTLSMPSDVTVQATSPSGAVVTFTASATDLVDGSVPVACTPTSGSTFPSGATTVICSAADKAGNVASASFKVTVSPTSTATITVKLLDSKGNGVSGAFVQYYSGGWKSLGNTGSDGAVSMALVPGTYNFQISYGGASQQKSQNVGTNPNVVFQTVQVHSDSGKCTGYNAGGWRTFTQDMELLPGTYMFRFSGKTANTSYTLVVGAVKHIH